MLTRKQKLDFYENGYVVIPGVVPRLMVDAARKAINHSIGAIGMHEGDLEKFRAQSYCNEVRNKPEIVNLFSKTPVQQIAEALMGEGNVQVPRFRTDSTSVSRPIAHRSERTAWTPGRVRKWHQRYGKRRVSAWVYCARCHLSCGCTGTLQRKLHRLAEIT